MVGDTGGWGVEGGVGCKGIDLRGKFIRMTIATPLNTN